MAQSEAKIVKTGTLTRERKCGDREAVTTRWAARRGSFWLMYLRKEIIASPEEGYQDTIHE